MLFLLPCLFAEDLPLSETPEGEAIGYSGTFLLPDARPRKQGALELGIGSGLALIKSESYCIAANGGGCGPSLDIQGLPNIRVGWTPIPDVRFETNLGWELQGGLAGSLVVSSAKAVNSHVRMGVFAGGIGWSYDGFKGAEGVLGGGMLISAFWPKMTLDASIPLVSVGLPEQQIPFYLSMAFSELSMSFRVAKGHSFRVGLVSFAPGVGWQYDSERIFFRADIHSLGAITVGKLEVGARL